MFIDTSVPNWNPFRMLALLALWLIAVAALAFAASGGCGNGTPQPTSGSVTLTWSITDLNHQPTTCAQVSARSVALRLRNRASGAVVATAFPCEANPGTAPVPEGVYDATFALTAADGTTLATAPEQTGVAVLATQIRRLAPVTFSASTQGGVAISLAALLSSTNCQSPGVGGAGITGTTITLERTDPGHEGCVPTTFVRRIGTQEVGTFVANDCSSPPVGACIERTETLTASVPAGTYRMRVVGKLAARDCWKAEAMLTVTVTRPLTTTLNLVRQPGC